jgi:hypothetical protein
MRPCAVCGGIEVDAAGRCARCGSPARRPRSPLIVPLIALSVTLVVLTVAIVVVVVRRAGPGTGKQGDASGGGSLVDNCVVGTWRTNHYEEDVPVNGVGNVKFTGQGAEVRLRADGTGVTDYKDGTTFTATINNIGYSLLVTGTVSFGYRAHDGTVSFSHVTAAGKETLTRADNGKQVVQDLSGDADPASYTCAGDALTEYTNRYRAELSRVNRTG